MKQFFIQIIKERMHWESDNHMEIYNSINNRLHFNVVNSIFGIKYNYVSKN